MPQKDKMDTVGAVALTGFAALLGFNQVVIKVVNDGLQPVFFAGLRSLGGLACLLLWMKFRGHRIDISSGTVPAGVLIGSLFSAEFLLLFLALDLTTVARASVILYSMPVWLAIAAHLLLPGDRLTAMRVAGLALAMAGVAWAILDRPEAGAAQLWGDLAALGAAMCWGGIALCARATSLSGVRPEMQLLWQVAVSSVLLLAAAPLFGPLIRDLQPLHLWGLGFQIVAIATAAFLFWFWLLTIYPASGVASFSFLSPVFGVVFGWLLLGERIGTGVLGGLVLVAAGLILINRRARDHAGATSAQTGR